MAVSLAGPWKLFQNHEGHETHEGIRGGNLLYFVLFVPFVVQLLS
jgi:hypothetical protein